ncbi:MAG: tRNA guanosine(15) transglycosylase TgtA [Candidatus Heimdallarchaeota archaeon]
MEFELVNSDALARIGRISLNHKELITPNLLPVIHPLRNLISTKDLSKMGIKALFTNAYTLYQNYDQRNAVLIKGIHDYLNFQGLVATDSGAFQQYMYRDGEIEIEATEIENFQEKIGSDFPVILDLPVQLDDDYESAKEKVKLTLSRARENIKRRKNENCAWLGPIHGGKYLNLVKKCTSIMDRLDFEIYAIGGLVKAFLNYRFNLVLKILLTARKNLTPNKPLHMFGLGLPQFFSLAVAFGCDLMDSAAYILYARENRYFTLSTGTRKLQELEEFPCHCPVCLTYSPKELMSFEEKLRVKLIAEHNLYLSISELRTIRQAIRDGNLWELVELRIRNHPNLVMAARLLSKNKNFFEIYEKVIKRHGRLYSSYESLNRPIIYRYISKLSSYYRVPEDARYLLILPELDIKSFNSPSIQNWIKNINGNLKIQRKYIHIVFCSQIYGIIPFELLDTFPMGQYESIKAVNENDIIYQNSLNYCLKFFQKHSKNYKKCAILIPKRYINQFNEIKKFSTYHPLNGLDQYLKKIFNSNFLISNNIEDIVQFFEENY